MKWLIKPLSCSPSQPCRAGRRQKTAAVTWSCLFLIQRKFHPPDARTLARVSDGPRPPRCKSCHGREHLRRTAYIMRSRRADEDLMLKTNCYCRSGNCRQGLAWLLESRCHRVRTRRCMCLGTQCQAVHCDNSTDPGDFYGDRCQWHLSGNWTIAGSCRLKMISLSCSKSTRHCDTSKPRLSTRLLRLITGLISHQRNCA